MTIWASLHGKGFKIQQTSEDKASFAKGRADYMSKYLNCYLVQINKEEKRKKKTKKIIGGIRGSSKGKKVSKRQHRC